MCALVDVHFCVCAQLQVNCELQTHRLAHWLVYATPWVSSHFATLCDMATLLAEVRMRVNSFDGL